MRKVVYIVETSQGKKIKTSSLSVAMSKGSKITTHLEEVEKPAPQLSAIRLAFLKSGAKPLHPYKGV